MLFTVFTCTSRLSIAALYSRYNGYFEFYYLPPSNAPSGEEGLIATFQGYKFGGRRHRSPRFLLRRAAVPFVSLIFPLAVYLCTTKYHRELMVRRCSTPHQDGP